MPLRALVKRAASLGRVGVRSECALALETGKDTKSVDAFRDPGGER